MAEEILYHGVRTGDGWISKSDLTLDQADELIQQHMHGANREGSYWLQEEEDHLVVSFFNRDEPQDSGYPGGNAVPKDGVWRSMRGEHSDKRKEFPNR